MAEGSGPVVDPCFVSCSASDLNPGLLPVLSLTVTEEQPVLTAEPEQGDKLVVLDLVQAGRLASADRRELVDKDTPPGSPAELADVVSTSVLNGRKY